MKWAKSTNFSSEMQQTQFSALHSHSYVLWKLANIHVSKKCIREAFQKKNIQNVNFFQKGGGVDPKVHIFEIEFLMN